jgi:two-component system chemotaxis response regulator CheB
MARIRILIVDGSVIMRRLLTHVLSSDSDLEVVGSAPTGSVALAKVPRLNPDLVTLDLEMPDNDGAQTLTALHKAYPGLPVILFTPVTSETRTTALEMLALGARDCVNRVTNISNTEAIAQMVRDELIPKIKKYCSAQSSTSVATAGSLGGETRGTSVQAVHRMLKSRTDVLVIGVSTGGPNALAELLAGFSADFPIPILIVQHIAPLFTRLLVDRLDKECHIRVSLGIDNEALEAGHAWLAPGGLHMTVQRRKDAVRIQTQQGPPENSCRPAVDVLFRSAAEVYGPHVLAVVLTGMGQDGHRGCERIRDAGGQIFVQDEASSVVWGMPGFVANAGLADKILPLQRLGGEIVRAAWECRSTEANSRSARSREELGRT